MDTNNDPNRNSDEAILKLIDGNSLDSSQADEVTGLVKDIKELWLLAKMAAASRLKELD